MWCMCDLVPFVQFKKHEKHPWRSVNFSKVAGTKINTPPWVFFVFSKLYKWYQIAHAPQILHVLSQRSQIRINNLNGVLIWKNCILN